ncbi:MAG TPA: response regulator transcription factor [Acidimicrobiales bacterium]|nr:response regulator transcription factor [Acidimicrobiales bacterium]
MSWQEGPQGPTLPAEPRANDEPLAGGQPHPEGQLPPGGQPFATILLAEDEEPFVDALVVGLTREGFEVAVARDGQEALQRFEEVEPDLVLLDLMLPKVSGIDVCRAIRSRSSVPVIIVTARSTELDTVVGLEVGADDYVTKPFGLQELVARVRAVLRRTSRATRRPPGGDVRPGEVLEAGVVRVDPTQRRVFVRGTEVRLRRKEFELLRLFVEKPGRVLEREVLIDHVWGADYVGDTRTLDVHIKRLRAQVDQDPASPSLIRTVRGVGYRFEPGS